MCENHRRNAAPAHAQPAWPHDQWPPGPAPPCAEPEASNAKPVPRTAITSEWSPKIDSACVATLRAATCMQNAVNSPAILNRSGSISKSPCDAVKVVTSASTRRIMHRACSRRLPIAFAPRRALHPTNLTACPPPRHRHTLHRGCWRDRVNGDDLAQPVGYASHGLVGIERAPRRRLAQSDRFSHLKSTCARLVGAVE